MIGDQEDYKVAKEWKKNKDAMNDIAYNISKLKQQYQECEYFCKQAVQFFKQKMQHVDILEVNSITHDPSRESTVNMQYVIRNNNNKITMNTIELF